MTGIKKVYLNKTSIQYMLDDFVLENIGFVTFRGGDWSVAYSPLAQEVLAAEGIREVSIKDNPDASYIEIVSRRGRNDFTNDDATYFFDIVSHLLKQNKLIDEAGLILNANAVPAEPTLNGDFGNAAAHYTLETFVPYIREKTSHDAAIEFVRFIKVDARNFMAAITLRNACSGCTTSVMGTLRNFRLMLEEHARDAKAITDDQRIAGFVVLPDRKGSPSFTFAVAEPQPVIAA